MRTQLHEPLGGRGPPKANARPDAPSFVAAVHPASHPAHRLSGTPVQERRPHEPMTARDAFADARGRPAV